MNKKRMLVFFILVLVIVSAAVGAGLYIDWLWFLSLGYGSLFETALLSAWAVRAGSWLFFALFLFINLTRTQKAILEMPNLVLRQTLMNTPYGNLLSKKNLRSVFLVLAAVVSWLATAAFGGHWLTVRLFAAGGSTGVTDPVFGADVAFYLFKLPLLDLVYQYLLTMLIVTAILCGAVYLFIHPPQQLGIRTTFAKRGILHLSLLVSLAFLVRAMGYWLSMYRLLYSPRGIVFGPGYTDIHAYLPAYRILFVLSVLAAVLLLLNMKLRTTKLFTGSIAGLLIASVLLTGIYPVVMQKFFVEPNEFVREEPYLQHNIVFTQRAYGLNRIEERDFPITGTLTYQELVSREGTISNIRLWDWRPLRDTYNQLQSLRLYYRFNDVDTGRYEINGKRSQIMLAARELVAADLTAPTWVNTRLSYTHGYGAVASPVTAVTAQGLPSFYLRDLPVQGTGDLQIRVPQIYYGELTDNYVITGTKTDEFDYPLGETNAFTRYEGNGGIPLGGFLRRALFALRFADYRILVSGELTNESRIHFDRTIMQRARQLAPFLEYDKDPYLVIADGRLYWIIDAYTVSSRYPYAQMYDGINYIRNSVKITVDAYHGDVRFYLFEPEEPLVSAYSKIFPGVFLPQGEMPDALKEHIRYPERLFSLQARAYATYHMNNSKVFYNKEDLWATPQEKYGESMIAMEPYYTILHLPGEKDAEFVLMLPYVMNQRNNMVAWLAGRSDGENYGQLVNYQFPKGELLYGPAQIEARIDQDTQISQQLTLWSQQGSGVIRGNLLVLPVGGSILYVEPLYLRAENGQLPELARVIVAYGDRIVMESSLQDALAAVFGLQPGSSPQDPGPGQPPAHPDASISELINHAAVLFEESQAALREGNWGEYGRLQDELAAVLARLQELAPESQPE